jgi:hypothetical protein
MSENKSVFNRTFCQLLTEKPTVQKYYTSPERLGRDKHSTLLQTIVNYGRKKFYNIGPWPDFQPFQFTLKSIFFHFWFNRSGFD